MWFKDSRPLAGGDTQHLSPDGALLQVLQANLSSAGHYSCVAANAAGERTKHVQLSVLGERWASPGHSRCWQEAEPGDPVGSFPQSPPITAAAALRLNPSRPGLCTGLPGWIFTAAPGGEQRACPHVTEGALWLGERTRRCSTSCFVGLEKRGFENKRGTGWSRKIHF